MDSIISKGERLLPAMFGGHMHRIRLVFPDGELWGYAGEIGSRADRGLTPAGWHVYALMGDPDGGRHRHPAYRLCGQPHV